ncbi:MAG: DEAD/DEAH box helicase family protein [Anaerolineae bacterium]|nr:DEAD/DEAH box helicase family protein [Anaerolineae bacterium]
MNRTLRYLARSFWCAYGVEVTDVLLRDHTFQLSYGPGDDRLHAFYIPALRASVRYDRMAGYFSSHALAIAAAGVAHLIANGGTMRLLAGAQLSHEDVAAIEAGYDMQAVVAHTLSRALPDPATIASQYLRERLEALAWLVAIGRLDIRVVLPKGPGGLPLPAPEARDYFHPKVGIFTDAMGDQVAFNGSINESVTGWEHNYEYFTVWRSWVSDESRAYVAEQVGRFTRLWEQREPDWFSLPVPDAARDALLRYRPAGAPARDPLERRTDFPVCPDDSEDPSHIKEQVKQLVLAPDLARERVVCQFLRDAPYLVGTTGLGAATCAIAPWPHQKTVAQRVIASYPARYLFCDEVGLGKTIEAGLVLRELWLRGTVSRALILTPKSVLRQWQEELHEKFALDVPVYDGKVFRDIAGAILPATTPNPWDSVALALASSQLVKRRERQQDLLQARPWDLILVDESHHARRKDFLDKTTYRPNRLLELLNALQKRAAGLVLMTATPMQVDPIEVWDLLSLLGLRGAWGADGRDFLRFYEQLRQAQDGVEGVDWPFLLRMFQAELAARGGTLDPAVVTYAQEALGVVGWLHLKQVLETPVARATVPPLSRISPQSRDVVVELLKHYTPLRRLVFRNTRALLREYRQCGMLAETVPTRSPQLQWIVMQGDARALYERIEDYIGNFYRKYEAQRKGLGFVMTVYRRRLTSSFYAVRRSLERRLAFLQGKADLELDEDDIEQDALSLDVDEAVEEDAEIARAYRREEIAYVEDFLHALRALGYHDAKVEQLLGDLKAGFRQRDTVLIFTQYTDTMDFLRERLREHYGSQIACYSGRGGEWWDGNAWVPITKEDLKNDFRQGERIKILLATDAASEGLNLQTCGMLINYDMPWNPMRVEQRIGRIDRIGQRYDDVWIHNYFYADTVEALVYKALSARIDWFQYIVGPLQPILAQVGRVIQTVAMTTGAARRRVLEEELADLASALDNVEANLDLDVWAERAQDTEPWPSPLTLPDLAASILASPTLAACLRPHTSIAGAFWLALDEQRTPVTFDRAVFDDYPNTLKLLTYGSPLLSQLLARVPPVHGISSEMCVFSIRDHAAHAPVLRLSVEAPYSRVAYYTLDAQGCPRTIPTLAALHKALEVTEPVSWDAERIAVAQSELQKDVEREQAKIQQGKTRLYEAQWETLIARTRRLALDAALVELALGQQPTLLDQETYPAAFNEMAVIGLRRHKHPWAPLLKLADAQVMTWIPLPTDPFFAEVQGEAPSRLKQRFAQLTQQARDLLQELATARNASHL